MNVCQILQVRVVKFSAVILAVACTASLAAAQAGAYTTGKYAASAVQLGDNGAAQSSGMTPERVTDILRADGYQAEIKNLGDGGHYVLAKITRDGLNYVLEFEFDKTNTTVGIICPLGRQTSEFSSAQLLALMKKSYELPCPMHFSYRGSSKLLCLEDTNYGAKIMTEKTLRFLLDRTLRTVKETQNLWDTNRWNGNGQVQVAPVQPQVVQNAKLADSVWIGSETLQGFDRLEFRFQANGKAVMIDAQGMQDGVYTQDGNTVTLKFFDGQVTYVGSINGQTLSGSAANMRGANWTFTVAKQ